MKDACDLAARKLLRRRGGSRPVARRSRPSASWVAATSKRVNAGRHPETDDSGHEERCPAITHYGSASGSSKKKVEPSPSAESTQTRPSI